MAGGQGQPVKPVGSVIDWEGFRPLLAQALTKPAKVPGPNSESGANDPLKMFKLLVVQRYDSLSDEQTEYQVSDRLSFQKFLGWTVADKVPDANTLWDFREALVGAGVFEKLFAQFAQPVALALGYSGGILRQKADIFDDVYVGSSEVMELVHPQSGKVVARQVREPRARQKQLLDALKLDLPATVPEAEVTVGTRKKINQVCKTLEK